MLQLLFSTPIWSAKLLAALGCGLVAGIFFAFSAFVMAALGQLPPAQGIAAMQAINVAVLNPLFFAVFLGTAAIALGLGLLGLLELARPQSALLIAGSVLYLGGSVLVTGLFNVPLNQALAEINPASAAGAMLWQRYLSSWTAWNHGRTLASLAAATAFSLALRQR